jgi:hypothetical protein
LNWFKCDYKDLYIPWGNKQEKRYFHALSKKELEKLLIQNNFEIIETYQNKNILFVCKKI